jgi:hypothetical protein
MLNATDPRTTAILGVLQLQRDRALEEVVLLAGDIAEAKAQIAALEAALAAKNPEAQPETQP